MREGVLGVSFDERLDEGCFPNAGRAHNGNDSRGRFGRKAVDKGDM